MQNAESLTKMKKDELVALCKQYGITGYSKLKKDELVAAIIAASASDSSCTEECTTAPAPAPAKKTCKTKSAKVAAAQTAKTADGIGDYCTALVNLWGIAPVEQVMQAYNYLCDATVTADEVAAAAKDAGCTIVGNELIHSRIADNEEELSTLRARKKLYPYYLPAKEDISTYLDESFRENSHAFLAMTGFFHRSMKLEEAVAAELTSKILSYLNSGTPLSALMNDLRERSVSFEDDEQFRNFAVLLDSLKNAARLWAFNGHTPTEAKAFEPAPEKKVPVRVIKVGRNDACPCGSGKKYKKCCGR